MTTIFVVSDTHFGHQGVCEFLRDDGTKLRPWSDAATMDEDMIELWNSVVKPTDKIYHLGDVLLNRRAFPTLGRLNGDKVLIKGNHDIYKLSDYTLYFRDVRAYHVLNKVILSHIPIHPDSKGRFAGNIHGHLHGRSLPDPWYHCVSVEQIGYKPVPFDEIMSKIIPV